MPPRQFYIFKIYLFIFRERERERERVSRGRGRGREVDSPLSTEPNMGLDLTTLRS